MARIRNLSVYSTDREYLQKLYDELQSLGRGRWLDMDLDEGRLTQLVYPPHKAKRAKRERNSRDRRD